MIESPNARWHQFKENVLLPAIVEMSVVNTPKAHAWMGGKSYQVGQDRFIYIHNTRSCGWNYLPLANHVQPIFHSTTTVHHHHYHVPTINHVRNHRTEDRQQEQACNQAIALAVIVGSIFGIIYTGYQMAHSFGQYFSSSKSIRQMDAEHVAIKGLTGLSGDQKLKAAEIVSFRNEYLSSAQKRSFWDIAQDVAIIAGLAITALGAFSGLAAPLMITGAVVVVASVIAKVLTHRHFPTLESAKNQLKIMEYIKKAQDLYKEEIEVHPPSEPYPGDQPPLYPDLEALRKDISQFYHVDEQALPYFVKPSAPPMGT